MHVWNRAARVLSMGKVANLYSSLRENEKVMAKGSDSSIMRIVVTNYMTFEDLKLNMLKMLTIKCFKNLHRNRFAKLCDFFSTDSSLRENDYEISTYSDFLR